MRSSHVQGRPSSHIAVGMRVVLGVLWMLGCAGFVCDAAGASEGRHKASRTQENPTDQLSIQVNDDRLTLSLAKVPQIYLSGVIDAEAATRFEKLIRTRRIRSGSDIYLNSPGGDQEAALALGRLFRAQAMATHLGVPRHGTNLNPGPKTSVCINACFYAYLGGRYRWAPAGNDRIGVSLPAAADAGAAGYRTGADVISRYLQEMGIPADAFAALALPGKMNWLGAEQLSALGIANNGRLPPTASYQSSTGMRTLLLEQTTLDGEHKVELLCRAEGLTLTAYDVMQGGRAQQIFARGIRSYFEIDHQPLPTQPAQRANVVDSAIVISGPFSMEQLRRLVTASSLGVWLADRNGAVRYGFTMPPNLVRNALENYYTQCGYIVRGAAVRASP